MLPTINGKVNIGASLVLFVAAVFLPLDLVRGWGVINDSIDIWPTEEMIQQACLDDCTVKYRDYNEWWDNVASL